MISSDVPIDDDTSDEVDSRRRLDLACEVGAVLGEVELATRALVRLLVQPVAGSSTRQFACTEMGRVIAEMYSAGLGSWTAARRPVRERGRPGPWRWAHALRNSGEAICEKAETFFAGRRRFWEGHATAWWTFAGLALTFIGAGLFLTGRYWAALGVVTARIAGSITLGGPSIITAAGDGVVVRRCRDLRQAVLSCASSHLGDVVLTTIAALVLAQSSRPLWALVAVASGTVALLGTIMRLALERGGVVIARSFVERVCRLGALLVGLTAAALSGEAATEGGIPALALIGSGMLVYGVFEVGRCLVVLAKTPVPVMALMIAVTSDGKVRVEGMCQSTIEVDTPLHLVA